MHATCESFTTVILFRQHKSTHGTSALPQWSIFYEIVRWNPANYPWIYIYIYIILNITLMMWHTHTIIPIKMVFFYVFQSTIKKEYKNIFGTRLDHLGDLPCFVVYIKPLGQKLQVPKSGLHRSHSVGTVTGKLRMCCWGFLWGEATHLLQGMKLRGKVPKRQVYLCSKLESITTSLKLKWMHGWNTIGFLLGYGPFSGANC